MDFMNQSAGPPPLEPTASWPGSVTPQMVIGINLRQLRGAIAGPPHATQGDVAESMRDLGFPWHHQTVSQIEQGRRNVTVGEVIGLGLVFNRSPLWFLHPHGAHKSTEVKVGTRTYRARDWLSVVLKLSEDSPGAGAYMTIRVTTDEETGEEEWVVEEEAPRAIPFQWIPPSNLSGSRELTERLLPLLREDMEQLREEMEQQSQEDQEDGKHP